MSFANKYRPKTLDKVIGHESIVTRLNGLIKSDKIPSAIAFFGPTSVGKTTLARCLAYAINEKPVEQQADYKEINAADERGIDDVRELVKLSKFKPQSNRRIIVIDEAQQILSNSASAQCIEADTKIVTNFGEISAKELYSRIQNGERIEALSFNHELREIEYKSILASQEKVSEEDMINLQGAKVTENHLIFSYKSGYTEAKLCNNDCVLIPDSSSRLKFSIDFVEITEVIQQGSRNVYDFQIEGNENFFICRDNKPPFLVHNCLLKPLEEPSSGTLWVICSMEPSKFSSTVGKAISNRCTQFILEPHTNNDLLKQAIRIAKGEKMQYVITEDKSILKEVVRNSNQEMRTLGNLMQALQQYYDGLEKKPKFLTKEHISSILSSVESSDDKLAIQLMIALYNLKYAKVQRCLLDVAEPFSFLKKLGWLSSFMLNSAVLQGERHSKVWWSASNRELHNATKNLNLTLGTLAAVNSRIIQVQSQASSFQIPATDLLSSELYLLIKELATK
jgi:DNA polymerase III gamma/tau subunit